MSTLKSWMPFLAGALVVTTFMVFTGMGQRTPEAEGKKVHRIIFQLSTPDTAAHRALTRQLNNLLGYWPAAEIEVVVHNKGMAMLQKEKTTIQPELTALKAKGVTFLACENTLKQQKIDKSQIVAESGFVPGGLVQVVTRQEQGWAYLKGGF